MVNAQRAIAEADAATDVSGCSEFDDAWTQGFKTLQFPPGLETRYLEDKAPERLQLLRRGTAIVLVLNAVLLLTDWFMTPDLFQVALNLRLFMLMPLTLACLLYLPRASRHARELMASVLSLMTAGCTGYLAVASTDPLGSNYLVALFVILLFNGGVIRMRFWLAARAAALILIIFTAGAFLVRDPPVAILISSAVVVVSTAVFALFSSYRSEHEERSTWLLSQRQLVLKEEVTHSNELLHRLSRFDPLTDIANRRHFDEYLQQVWERARGDGQDVALLMIDIDHFKPYNDHYGHAQGDACLQAVAKAFQAHVRRPEDLIARYGGEEFVAVLPGADLSTAMAAATRVLQGVTALGLVHAASPGLKQVTLSIGVASMRANDAHAHPEKLLARADAALYEAKAHGRHAVQAFDPVTMPDTAGNSAERPAGGPSAVPAPNNDPVSQELDRALLDTERPLSLLRFPARLEQQFQRESAPDRLHYFTLCGVVAFVVFNGFLITDYLLARDVFWLAVQVRLGIFTPIALGLLCIAWFCPTWLLKRPPALTEGIVVASGVGAAACLAYVFSASQMPTSQLYHIGLSVIIIYGNLVQRLRFWYAVAFSLSALAIHLGYLLSTPDFNPRLTWPLITSIIATALFTLMANHALERDHRRRYLLTLSQAQVLKQLEAVRSSLQTLSRVDALTGLFNRRHFHEYLQQVWLRAQHRGDGMAIVMLDVDHFKKFNDHYGHQAGDACLAKVAQAMKACLRQPHDLVARLGGEEFIAVLPLADLATALAAAERIREAVQALQIPHAASTTAAVVTVSLGVASAAVRPDQTEAALMKAADMALYQAKREGRNRVAVSPADTPADPGSPTASHTASQSPETSSH